MTSGEGLAKELAGAGLPEAPVPFWNAPGSNEPLGLVVCVRESWCVVLVLMLVLVVYIRV